MSAHGDDVGLLAGYVLLLKRPLDGRLFTA